jgi:hypothetical protein
MRQALIIAQRSALHFIYYTRLTLTSRMARSTGCPRLAWPIGLAGSAAHAAKLMKASGFSTVFSVGAGGPMFLLNAF